MSTATTRFSMLGHSGDSRWVVVSYGDGQGTPQTRDIVARAGETAIDAGIATVTALAAERGYPMHLYTAAETGSEPTDRHALLLSEIEPVHTARPDHWQNRFDAVALSAFETWTKNGIGLSFEENEEAIKSCRDATTNAWVEGMNDGEWLAATLAQLG